MMPDHQNAGATSETAAERILAGEQLLVRGVPPVSIPERLAHSMRQPMTPANRERPLDIGLGACAPAREAGSG
jgi:hypothetical protein